MTRLVSCQDPWGPGVTVGKKGHHRRPGDEDLVERFLARIEKYSVRDAEKLTGVSRATINRLRQGEWTGLITSTRNAIQAYLERPEDEDGQDAELLLVASYLDRIAEQLRRWARSPAEARQMKRIAPELLRPLREEKPPRKRA